jgi:hypothetical protein
LPKQFTQHADEDAAFDECSIVYTVFARSISTPLSQEVVSEIVTRAGIKLMDWTDPAADVLAWGSLARNLAPLWSERPTRQSGFGLRGVGPKDDDSWGSVLGVVEHRFHPTFWPQGWDRIGGAQLEFNGGRFLWNDDTSGLAGHILPSDNNAIARIRYEVTRVLRNSRFS